MSNSSENDTLADALARHGLQLPDDQQRQLDRYCRLLWQWNDKLNLTRHTDYEKFVTRDLIDSLELAKLLDPDEEVLDVGTGGGVPGVILAIVRPDLQVTLCESVAKKAGAVNAIVEELELPVAIYNARAEDLLQDLRFGVLVARAVGPLWKLCHWFGPHRHSFDKLLVVKGPRWIEERNEARHRGLLKNFELRRVTSYAMPATESESVILKLWAKGRPEQ